MNMTEHGGCGGTILWGASGAQRHWYCDRCGAFTYKDPGEEGFPTGRDKAKNTEAYDNQDDRSPEEE